MPRLQAAKRGGWLSEEEFDEEVKRVIRDFNGESREPAYDFERVMEVMEDEEQMAEWEARYGSGAEAEAQSQEGPTTDETTRQVHDGLVELDLTGGGAVESDMDHANEDGSSQKPAQISLDNSDEGRASPTPDSPGISPSTPIAKNVPPSDEIATFLSPDPNDS
eukprot:748501-Hanusia_phi.AAC.3